MSHVAIARSARRLRLLVLAGIALVLALYLLGRFAPQIGPVRIVSHAPSGWVGQVVSDAALLLFLVALARLAQMLSAIADGPLFGPRVTRAFHGFAFWLFVATLVDVLAGPASVAARIVDAGSGHAALMFELRDLLMLAGTLFLFLLSRMLEQARAIESELEEIV